jgi:AcrR family transcriptional regulator
MRSLGKRLGAAATAVYWHVKNKDDLVLLAADRVWHPWLVQAIGSHLLHGTGKARYDDHLLGVFETAGFTQEEADRAVGAVVTSVLAAKAAEVAEPFPRLRARLDTAAATGYGDSPDGTYPAGLRALLEGLRPGGTEI